MFRPPRRVYSGGLAVYNKTRSTTQSLTDRQTATIYVPGYLMQAGGHLANCPKARPTTQYRPDGHMATLYAPGHLLSCERARRLTQKKLYRHNAKNMEPVTPHSTGLLKQVERPTDEIAGSHTMSRQEKHSKSGDYHKALPRLPTPYSKRHLSSNVMHFMRVVTKSHDQAGKSITPEHDWATWVSEVTTIWRVAFEACKGKVRKTGRKGVAMGTYEAEKAALPATIYVCKKCGSSVVVHLPAIVWCLPCGVPMSELVGGDREG